MLCISIGCQICDHFVHCSDSHEFIGDDNDSSYQGGAPEDDIASETKDPVQEESMETEIAATNGTKVTEESDKDKGSQEMEVADNAETGEKMEEEAKEMGEEEEEYNPLIVRRSRRAIKPTKDVDLYLLGAQFGIDVEGLSDADSSDQEFAPAVESDRELFSVRSWLGRADT